MAKKYDGEKAARKQVQRVEAAAQDYVDAIQAIQEHPGQKAARKKGKMKARWNAAVDSGKWEEGVTGYSLDDLKAKVREVGAERIASGARASLNKSIEFHNQLSDHIARTQDSIDQIDDSTEAGAKQKMNANFDRMKQFKRVRRRR